MEAPQVDPGFRFIKDRKGGAARQHHGDLDALQLAAGQAGIQLAVDVVPGAQSHFAEVGTDFADVGIPAGGQVHQVADPQALKPYRLLKGVADAPPGALGHRKPGNILAVQQQAASGGAVDAGDDFGQGGFPAAVGAGDGHKAVLYHQVDIVQDLTAFLGFVTDVLQFQHIVLLFAG